MRTFTLIGLAVLVCGAAGQSQYKPGGASGSSSGKPTGGSGGRPTGSTGGASSGVEASGSGGGSFASPGRPGSGAGGAGGSSNSPSGGSDNAGGESSGSLEDAVPGVPGEDYPIFAEVPQTSFLCDGQVDGGYYADPETDCQVFHICSDNGQGSMTKYSFLCPNGTLFQQQYFVCDWWFNVDCSLAESLYSRNAEVAAERELFSAGSGNQNGNGNQGGNQGRNQGKNAGGSQGNRDQDAQRAGSEGSSRGGSTGSRKDSSSTKGKSSTSGKGASGAGGKKSSSSNKGPVKKGSQGAASNTKTNYAAPGQDFSGEQADTGYGSPGGFNDFDAGFENIDNYARSARAPEHEPVDTFSAVE